MASLSARLIIVKRGKDGAFRLLNNWLKEAPDVEVIWDRRTGEDRRQRRGVVQIECRDRERRRRLDPHCNVFMPMASDLWSVYRYVATKACSPTRA